MALRRRRTTPAPLGSGVSRRDFFSLGARRVLPDEEDVAAIGEALRQFHDAEAGIDHDALEARAEEERVALARAEELARTSWSRGDLAAQARALAPAADVLVAAAGIRPGDRVVDVGAGDGTVALAAAAAGARVTALDLDADVVALGRSRCEREGVEVDWHVGDAAALPFADDLFDCALSGFGVIFAPRPRLVAAELARVTRPGGFVGLTAWSPTGLMGHVLDLTGSMLPAPADAVRPARWGRFESAFLWLERAVAGVEMTDHELAWAFPDADAAVAALVAAPGPLGAALEVAEPAERDRAHEELLGLVGAFDAAGTEAGVRLPVAYRVVSGRAPQASAS